MVTCHCEEAFFADEAIPNVDFGNSMLGIASRKPLAMTNRRDFATTLLAMKRTLQSLSVGGIIGAKGKLVMGAKNKVVHRTEYPHIVMIDGVSGGQAVIEGTRIAVWHIVGYYYKVGMSVEDILAEWNYLTPAQIFSALAYYHDHKQEVDQVREQNSYERNDRCSAPPLVAFAEYALRRSVEERNSLA